MSKIEYSPPWFSVQAYAATEVSSLVLKLRYLSFLFVFDNTQCKPQNRAQLENKRLK